MDKQLGDSISPLGRPITGSVSVRIGNGDARSGNSLGEVFIPFEENGNNEVELTVVFEPPVSNGLFGSNYAISFASQSYHYPVLKGEGRILERGRNVIQVGRDSSENIYIFAEIYTPWAEFSEGGINHGKFLPIMMSTNKFHRIRVHPIGHVGGDVEGSYYGLSDYVDVLAEQVAENNAPSKTIEFSGRTFYELGGPGKSERYIRVKGAAPLGAIPLVFVASDGKRGWVNLERV